MLITHANLITWEQPNRIFQDYALRIENGLIVELGPSVELRTVYPNEEVCDAHGQYVLPGNICAHTHFYGAFARGMPIPGDAPAEFTQILQKLWWPLDQSLTLEDVRFSALVCLIDAIKHGTTTLFDHHASPKAIEGSLDSIAQTVDQAGLRAVLCYEVTDRNGADGARRGIEENARFLKQAGTYPLIVGCFGLHAALTISNQTLKACRDAVPEDTGFHIHLSESRDDMHSVGERGNGWPVDWLNNFDILGPRTITAHAVYVDDYEIGQLAETGTWVTHQPRSNMNNGVGVAPVEKMLADGVRVCLGNDGFSNAMWEEWKAAYLLHKLYHEDPRRMSGNTVVQIAVHNNAALAGTYFPQAPIGVIRPGAVADLIFVDYHPFTTLTADNLPWHILFGGLESMVTTTIVAGKMLMRDRKLLTLDEIAIAAQAKELSAQVWQRYRKIVGV